MIVSSENRLFVYRPVVNESLVNISNVQQEFKNTIDSYWCVAQPHLTLAQADVSELSSPKKLDLLYDAPDSSLSSISMRVESVQFLGLEKRLASCAIALVFESGVTSYGSERRHFKKRLYKAGRHGLPKSICPHVTLGTIRSEEAVESTLSIANNLLDTEVEFGPVESNLGDIHTKNERPHSYVAPIEEVVTTIRPHSIPTVFLDSLRQKEIKSRND